MQRTAACKAASLTARQRQSWEEAFAQVPSLHTQAPLVAQQPLVHNPAQVD